MFFDLCIHFHFYRVTLLVVTFLIVSSQADFKSFDGVANIIKGKDLIASAFLDPKWWDCMIDTLQKMGVGDDIKDPRKWFDLEKLKEKLGMKYDIAKFICDNGGQVWVGFYAIVLILLFLGCCGCCCFCCVLSVCR
jgi:hypothetical protein